MGSEIYLMETTRVFILLFVTIAVAKLLSFLDRIALERVMREVSDDKLLKMKRATKMAIFWSVILAGFYLVLRDVIPKESDIYVRGSVYTIIILLFSYATKKVTDVMIDFTVSQGARKGLIKMSKNVSNAMKNVTDIMIFSVAFFLVFWAWGVRVGPLLTSMGLVGAGVAFAAQATISNFFSGLIIYFDHRVRVGDYVNFNGISGVVEEIRTLSTRIRTWDNTLVTVPNSSIVNNPIEDRHLPEIEKKVKVKLSFVYGTDVEKAKKVIIKTVKKIKTVIGEPVVYLTNLGDYSVDLLLVASVKSIEDVWTTTCEVNEKVYNACNKAGLEFAFPTQTLEVKNAGKDFNVKLKK